MSLKKLSMCLPKCYENLKPHTARNLHHLYFYTVFFTKTIPFPTQYRSVKAAFSTMKTIHFLVLMVPQLLLLLDNDSSSQKKKSKNRL